MVPRANLILTSQLRRAQEGRSEQAGIRSAPRPPRPYLYSRRPPGQTLRDKVYGRLDVRCSRPELPCLSIRRWWRDHKRPAASSSRPTHRRRGRESRTYLSGHSDARQAWHRQGITDTDGEVRRGVSKHHRHMLLLRGDVSMLKYIPRNWGNWVAGSTICRPSNLRQDMSKG